MVVAKLIINSIPDKNKSKCLFMLHLQDYFSATSFCFLVPLVLGIVFTLQMKCFSVILACPDPAISSVQHGFTRSLCRTVRGQYSQGKQHCAWTSCREGCTHEVYTCWQLEVSKSWSGGTSWWWWWWALFMRWSTISTTRIRLWQTPGGGDCSQTSRDAATLQ